VPCGSWPASSASRSARWIPDVPSWQSEVVRLVPDGPPVGQQKLSRGVPCAHSPDPVADPEPLQHPQAVRCQRHARADLGQLLRLLIHLDVDPGPRQRHRRRDPADPAADHHRPQSHALPSSNGTHPRPTLTPWAWGVSALGGKHAAEGDDGKPEHVPRGRALVRLAALAGLAG
jgi:hypothetical protein